MFEVRIMEADYGIAPGLKVEVLPKGSYVAPVWLHYGFPGKGL